MKSIGIAALCVLAFAGCADIQQGAVPTTCVTPPPDTVITVLNGYAGVTQEPICVNDKNVMITWVLNPAQTAQYELRGDSIVVTDDNDDEFLNCKGTGNGGDVDGTKKKIKCQDKNNKHGQLPARRYHYTIKVYSVDSPLDEKPAATYDPTIMNN